MGDKPIWEQIGSSFVQHYYQLFDADRTQLGAIYVSIYTMGAWALCHYLSRFPFVDHVGANKFYSMWECSRELLDLLCIPVSPLTEGSVFCFSGVIQVN